MKAIRFINQVLIIITLLGYTNAFAQDSSYYSGEIKFEINEEIVEYKRVWKCERRTFFRPSNQDLFEKFPVQVQMPSESMVVKVFGRGDVVVFDNWMGCANELTWTGDWTRIGILNSADEPTYGELHFLKVGGSLSVLNPYSNGYRVRLVNKKVVEIDENLFKRLFTLEDEKNKLFLFQLRKKAAFRIQATVLAWNFKDQRAFYSTIPIRDGAWNIDQLETHRPNSFLDRQKESPPRSSVFIPLPFNPAKKYQKTSVLSRIKLLHLGNSIQLNESGYAEILNPQLGIRLARIYISLEDNVWNQPCWLPNTDLRCPQIPNSKK